MKTSQRLVETLREWRRLRAWDLHEQGWKQQDIATALAVSPGAVSQWLATGREHGREALRSKEAHGGPSKLTSAQKRLLPDILWHGAEAYGFRGEVWTCARLARVIQREFGVTYHKHHVSRLLKELGWTPQIPLTRAFQRDEEALGRWREEVWPRLKKGAAGAKNPCFYG